MAFATNREAQEIVRKIRKIVARLVEQYRWKSGYFRTDQIPDGVRMDVSRVTAGNIVQTRYGGFGRAEHGHGDPYMTIRDYSDRSEQSYRWDSAPKVIVTLATVSSIGGVSVDIELGDLRREHIVVRVGEDVSEQCASAVAALVDFWNSRFA